MGFPLPAKDTDLATDGGSFVQEGISGISSYGIDRSALRTSSTQVHIGYKFSQVWYSRSAISSSQPAVVDYSVSAGLRHAVAQSQDRQS